MNPKQQRFCEEYLIDRIGTQAAIRAGYAANSAHVTGSRLLKNAKVRDHIDQLFAEQRDRIEISVDSLTKLLLADRDLAHDNKQAGAAVSATEKLAKLHGLMTERLRVDVNVTADLSDAELDAQSDEVDRERVSVFGRDGILERIAHWQQYLVRFDRGEFDDILLRRFARVPASPPLVALPASEFQAVSSEK